MSSGLYIHIPFCISKCPYCDFYSIAGADEKLKKRYVEALIREIRHTAKFFTTEGKDGFRLQKSPIDSIYFGGGTPSLLGKEDFIGIFSAISDAFGDEYLNNAEITIEVNPGTIYDTAETNLGRRVITQKKGQPVSEHISRQKLEILSELPFNRISIGVQSFDNGVLKRLGRIHSSSDSYMTIKAARAAGFSNISIDLMFGMERQSLETWMDSVKRAVELKPEHISLYSLEIAEGTEFGRRLGAGKMFETDPEVDRKMYEEAIKYLGAAGYEQYEISNFYYKGGEAKRSVTSQDAVNYSRDYRSKHNLKYWGLEEYIGYGAGAHSYVRNLLTGKGKRYYHARDIEAYIENPESIIAGEENEFSDDINEYTITALRLREGIDKREFFERFGLDFWEFYGDLIRLEFHSFVETGYAAEDEKNIRLTIKGFNVSNRILALFV